MQLWHLSKINSSIGLIELLFYTQFTMQCLKFPIIHEFSTIQLKLICHSSCLHTATHWRSPPLSSSTLRLCIQKWSHKGAALSCVCFHKSLPLPIILRWSFSWTMQSTASKKKFQMFLLYSISSEENTVLNNHTRTHTNTKKIELSTWLLQWEMQQCWHWFCCCHCRLQQEGDTGPSLDLACSHKSLDQMEKWKQIKECISCGSLYRNLRVKVDIATLTSTWTVRSQPEERFWCSHFWLQQFCFSFILSCHMFHCWIKLWLQCFVLVEQLTRENYRTFQPFRQYQKTCFIPFSVSFYDSPKS